MKFKPYSVVAIVIFLCSTFILGSHAAFADNSHIPDEYESAYHKLLERKQHLMDDRADSIKNLEQCESWIAQIDKALKIAGK
jgi:hypothetical protein